MDNELYHYGTKGMKWGVRRFQNKDGSLTAAGRKRLGYGPARKSDPTKDKIRAINANSKAAAKKLKQDLKNQAKIEKAEAKAKAKLDKVQEKHGKKRGADVDKTADTPIKKSISQMSDAELKDYVNRKNMERQAYDLQKQISQLNPKQLTTGQKFVKGLTNDVIVPAAKDIGKQYLSKMSKDKLGLSESSQKDIYEIMQQEVKNYNTQKAYDKMKAEKAAEKQAAKDGNKTKTTPTENKQSGDNAKTTSKNQRSNSSSNSKVHTGTVEGVGTSRRSSSDNSTKRDPSYYEPIDADWSYSDASNSHSTSVGQRYIAGLLEPPKKR